VNLNLNVYNVYKEKCSGTLEKAKPSHQNMPRLRASFHMAQEVGEGLGKREVLQPALPQA